VCAAVVVIGRWCGAMAHNGAEDNVSASLAGGGGLSKCRGRELLESHVFERLRQSIHVPQVLREAVNSCSPKRIVRKVSCHYDESHRPLADHRMNGRRATRV
jgi:hypothetical protein